MTKDNGRITMVERQKIREIMNTLTASPMMTWDEAERLTNLLMDITDRLKKESEAAQEGADE